MNPKLALFLCILFILWLLRQERKRHLDVSNALWAPLLWFGILGSRPLSMWFGFGGDGQGDPTDGSPFDRFVFQALIVLGLVILARRRVGLSAVIKRNKWLFLFFLYLGISVIWSDYPFVSLKRWIKDVGNIVMVLVVLSEANPEEAIKALFERCSYVLIPLSIVFIKYLSDLGRVYNRWTGEASWVGVATEKNTLGMTVMVCGIGMLWSMMEWQKGRTIMREKTQVLAQMMPLMMAAWLLYIANSATSLACSLLGGGMLLGSRVPAIRKQMGHFWLYGAAVAVVVVSLTMFRAEDAITGALGRDSTFTGRVDIWKNVLREDINPLLGTGYYSFWLGDRSKRISQGYYYELNEAHDGYLETYLNSGLIGLILLLAFLVAASNDIRKELELGGGYAGLRIALFAIAVMHNLTESGFDRLNAVWFGLLLVAINCPGSRKSALGSYGHGLEKVFPMPAPRKAAGNRYQMSREVFQRGSGRSIFGQFRFSIASKTERN